MTLERKQNIGAGFLCILCGLFLIPVFIYTDNSKWGTISRDDLLIFKTTLLQDPKISHSSKGNYDITMRLGQFPNFSFTNSGIFYSAINARQFCSDIVTNDSIEIGLLANEYTKKISKTKSTNWFEKLIYNQKDLSIYSLVYKGQEYVNLDYINDKQGFNNSPFGRLLMALVSVLFLFFGFRFLKKH